MTEINSLVSVIISTYNSSSFIIETLESVRLQTWEPIELIVTDDNSTDNTVQVCQKWLKDNGARFQRSEILTTTINTGVSGNANRGLKKANGAWIKFLGADDALKPGCIEDNMLWIRSRSYISVLFSGVDIYRNTFDPENFIQTTPGIPYTSNGILAKNKSVELQYKMLLLSDRIHFTPSVFLRRNAMQMIGGFDERFKLLEDYPLWLNLTRNGYKLYFMDKVTVNYRRHLKAINNTGVSFLVNPNYFRSERFRRIYTYPYLPVDIRLEQRFNWYVSQIFRIKMLNQDNKVNRFLLSVLTIYLNPFKYYIWLKKRLNIRLKNEEFYC